MSFSKFKLDINPLTVKNSTTLIHIDATIVLYFVLSLFIFLYASSPSSLNNIFTILGVFNFLTFMLLFLLFLIASNCVMLFIFLVDIIADIYTIAYTIITDNIIKVYGITSLSSTPLIIGNISFDVFIISLYIT